jgi:hypothetical protein
MAVYETGYALPVGYSVACPFCAIGRLSAWCLGRSPQCTTFTGIILVWDVFFILFGVVWYVVCESGLGDV